MIARFRFLWTWLTKNWEPITSVAAVTVSIWSTVLAYQGITLANRGVELAEKAQRGSDRAALLSRTPIFSPYIGPKALSVKNLGVGPGNLYQINVSYGELQATIESTLPRQGAGELKIFLEGWLAAMKGLPEDFKSKISVDDILGLYNVGQENYFIRMKDGSDLPQAFYDQAMSLVLTVCFSDLAADLSGSATLGQTDKEELLTCNPPQSLVNFY